MKILAIESSCDETAAAVIEKTGECPVILSNVVASQIDIHKKYGGVVPEVAARAHIENIIPVIREALATAKTNLAEVDRIAVTYGPGLIGSLVVGVETAKAIGIAKEIPVFPINHLEGHIYASFACSISNFKFQISNFKLSPPRFPVLALLVSGGNSLLVLIKNHFDFEVVGQTRDDAAGEAFDKGARLLGLGYPGGPIISKVATQGHENKYDFPIIDLTEKPKRGQDGFLSQPEPSLDFSFSGLKTALLTKTKTLDLAPEAISDLAAGYEKAIVNTLVQNTLRTVKRYQPETFVLAGGVAANKKLRETLVKKLPKGIELRIPDISLCGDNAAMIGIAAAFKPDFKKTSDFAAEPNLKL